MEKNKLPLILAHRGLVTKYQENTMPAIEAALESPHCNGSEFDVFLTKDNKVVLFHDENLKRVTGVDKSIYDMTWDDLKTIQILKEIEVDGGIRQYEKPLSIPLLEDVLETIKGKDFFSDIELKAYSPKYSKRKTGREVAKIVKKMNMKEQVICTSFNFFMLYDMEKYYREIQSGFGYDSSMPLSMKWINKIMEANIIGKLVHSNAVCNDHKLIDNDTIQKYHNRNMKVGTFTLYPLMPGEMPAEKKAYFSNEVKRLALLGVDWIETDQPELVWKDLND